MRHYEHPRNRTRAPASTFNPKVAGSIPARPIGSERSAKDRGARHGRTPVVITRLWRGWTATQNADAYEQFLLSELFPSMRRIPGFRGADVLRRHESDETAFVILTRFDSLDDIREFAGEDDEVPVLEPQALALLSHYDERALHFETASFST
jgi:hypothetical protein